jgi:GT2 family glycosyltransferase
MINKITLSIIIVNFNTETFLINCLNSVKSSDFPKNKLEIIVIDNNSKVNPSDYLKKQFPKVKFIINDKNEGFAKANNKAIKYAKGSYVLFLNPDTILPPKVLSVLIQFMEKNKLVGVSTARVELENGTIDDSCHRGFPTPWNSFCHFSGLNKIMPLSKIFNGYHLGYKNMEIPHEIDSCSGAFMLVRKKAGEQVGWFDEDYFWYGEDIDFCFKVKNNNWKIYFIPAEIVLHFKGVASGIKKHSSAIASASSETRLLATHARFEVMRIFYEKHYKNKYPKFLKNLIFTGIKIKEILTVCLQKVNHN